MKSVIITIEVDGKERLDRFNVGGKPEEIRGIIEAKAGELYHKIDELASFGDRSRVTKPAAESVTKPARGGNRKKKDG